MPRTVYNDDNAEREFNRNNVANHINKSVNEDYEDNLAEREVFGNQSRAENSGTSLEDGARYQMDKSQKFGI